MVLVAPLLPYLESDITRDQQDEGRSNLVRAERAEDSRQVSQRVNQQASGSEGEQVGKRQAAVIRLVRPV